MPLLSQPLSEFDVGTANMRPPPNHCPNSTSSPPTRACFRITNWKYEHAPVSHSGNTIMSDPTEIAFTFKIARDYFNLIRLKPNNHDLHRLNEVLVVTYLSVNLTGTNSGTSDGVVISDVVYKSNNGRRAFDFMHTAREDYDPSIARLGKEDHISKMRGMEYVWKAGTDNQNWMRAVEVDVRNLIIANVKTMWIQELRHPYTFFTAVPPRYLLDHLARFGTGLDCPSGVELILSLNKIWDSNPRFNQFIINMEISQKKLDCANLPITDGMLDAFATYMLLKSCSFPRDPPTWDGKSIMDQTWNA